MKRSLVRLILALLPLGAWVEVAAQTTPVSSPSGGIQMGGVSLAQGSAVFVPVDVYGHPIPVTLSGGTINLPGSPARPVGYSCAIASGAISGCSVPDEVTSSPSGFCYAVTISDTSLSGTRTSGMSFKLPCVHGITGSSAFRLDQYTPTATVPTLAAVSVTSGSGAPTSTCAGPCEYVDTTAHDFYFNTGTGWVKISGSSGSSVTFPAGLLWGGGSTSAPTAANSSQVQGVIGSGVYDAAGAAAAATFHGGTVTNPIVLPADPTTNLQAATKQYVDSHAGSGSSSSGVLGAVQKVGNTTGSFAAATGDVDYQSHISTPPPMEQNIIASTGNAVIALNRFQFNDGTYGWAAGSGYFVQGMFIDDFALTAMARPDYFTAPQILNIVTKFLAAVDGSGQIPPSIYPDGTASNTVSPWTPNTSYYPGDGWIMVPQLCYLHYLKTGSTACYHANVTAIKTAMLHAPRNGSTHLPTIVSGSEYISGTLFHEGVRGIGDVAESSVWLAYNDKAMGLMATADGDATNATYFNGDYSLVTASIPGTLTNGSTHMLNFATVQNVQSDIGASAMACSGVQGLAPILGATQCGLISDYLNTNYSTLTHNGYIGQSTDCWPTTGFMNTGNGSPYTSAMSCGGGSDYQNGYWTYHFAWVAATLAINHPAQTQQLITDLMNGANFTAEYISRNNAVAGTDLNMESANMPVQAANQFPPSFLLTPGIAQVNRFGQVTGTVGVNKPFFQGSTYVAITPGSSASLTTPSYSVPAGDLVVVFCQGGASTRTVTSSPSETWHAITGQVNTGPPKGEQMSWAIIGTSGSHTFTCTPPSAEIYTSMIALDYGGTQGTINTSFGTFGNNGSGTGLLLSPSFTTTQRTLNIWCGTEAAASGNFTIGAGAENLRASDAGVGTASGATAACMDLVTSGPISGYQFNLIYNTNQAWAASGIAVNY